jgi:hypothetical protein
MRMESIFAEIIAIVKIMSDDRKMFLKKIRERGNILCHVMPPEKTICGTKLVSLLTSLSIRELKETLIHDGLLYNVDIP